MALRIRKDGRILCAALHPVLDGDTYIDDALHYELSVVKKVICTESHNKHKIRGEWWWTGNVPEDITIDPFYFNSETNPATDKYKYCNHHHELTDQHELVDFGDGDFVANKIATPLLKALNELGLRTRTHHVDNEGGFVSILLDNVRLEVKTVFEKDAARTKYNGKTELLIFWNNKH